MPLAYLLSGPLADHVFIPLLDEGGRLAPTALGRLLGTGPGRGIGLMFVLAGLLVVAVSLGAYLYRPLRRVESELPDAVGDGESPAAAAPAGDDGPATAAGAESAAL